MHAGTTGHAKVFKPCLINNGMAWTKPLYGKAKIDKAGHVLTNDGSTEEEKEEALTILNISR